MPVNEGTLGDISMNVQRLVDHLHKIGYPKPVSARKYVQDTGRLYIFYTCLETSRFNCRQFDFDTLFG